MRPRHAFSARLAFHRWAINCSQVMGFKLITSGGTDLRGKTPLWRYMKLSCFIQMMEKRIFIPKLSELQKGDRNEAKVTSQMANFPFWRAELEDKQCDEWLRSKSDYGESALWNPGMREEVWLSELAKRRCIWCWYSGERESITLWKIYAEGGIAIKSSVGKVLEFLRCVENGVYGRVQYLNRSDSAVHLELHHRELQWHPYFAKQECYKDEDEVRFIFRDDADWQPGCFLRIEHLPELLDGVVISPFLQSSEAAAVKRLISRHLSSRLLKISTELSDEADSEDDSPPEDDCPEYSRKPRRDKLPWVLEQ